MPDDTSLIAPTRPPFPKPANVRVAGPADFDALFTFLLPLHEENGLVPLSEERVAEHVRRCTDHQGGIAGIIDGPGGIIGSVGLVWERYWYSDQWAWFDLWNYIGREHRSLRLETDLIGFAKHIADSIGPMPLMMAVLTNDRAEAKVRLYSRHMRFAGGIFTYGGSDV
jgi:hypothetical protein